MCISLTKVLKYRSCLVSISETLVADDGERYQRKIKNRLICQFCGKKYFSGFLELFVVEKNCIIIALHVKFSHVVANNGKQ